MSVPVHAPHFVWARAHMAALAIALMVMAIAAGGVLLITRLRSDAAPAPATSVSTVHVPSSGGDTCPQMGRPGPTPC